MLEYLVKWNEVHQYFLLHKLKPVDGMIAVPDRPGMVIELDEDKVSDMKELVNGMITVPTSTRNGFRIRREQD